MSDRGDGVCRSFPVRRGALWSDVLRFQAFRTLLPALYTVALGYGLSAFGWDDDWMPLAYVMITSLLVLTQAFAWSNRRQGLRNLYWASMSVLLVFPALRFAPMALPDHNLLGTWEIDLARLGSHRHN